MWTPKKLSRYCIDHGIKATSIMLKPWHTENEAKFVCSKADVRQPHVTPVVLKRDPTLFSYSSKFNLLIFHCLHSICIQIPSLSYSYWLTESMTYNLWTFPTLHPPLPSHSFLVLASRELSYHPWVKSASLLCCNNASLVEWYPPIVITFSPYIKAVLISQEATDDCAKEMFLQKTSCTILLALFLFEGDNVHQEW